MGIGPPSEPKLKEAEVGRIERLHPRLVVLDFRIDRSVFGLRKEHGTPETVPKGENPGELRKSLFGAILLVASKEHDVLSESRPRIPHVNEGFLTGRARQQGGG